MNIKEIEDDRICRQCLLREYDKAAYDKTIKDYIERISENDRTPEAEYTRRMKLCLACDKLNAGTCLSCGCYVELCGAARHSHCPKKKW